MTQSQHTQGPWKINSKITDRALELYPDAPISIVSGGNGCGYTAIAQVLCGSRDSAHENKANAQLIASAPDMLEALEDLLRDIPIKHRPIDAFKKAVNATRKAKGEL